MKNRVLTVESLVRPRFSYSFLNTQARVFSKIRLQGKWLTELGFKPGDKINVITENNRLVIERSAS